jgi:benzoate-CoA ligase
LGVKQFVLATIGRDDPSGGGARVQYCDGMNAAEDLLVVPARTRRGEATALVSGRAVTTYAELARDVERASGALRALGARPGERVLLLMRDTPEFAAAWLGAVRSGAVAIALNNKVSEAEYRHILADSAARLVIVDEIFAAARPDLNAELGRAGKLAIAGENCGGAPSWRDCLHRAQTVAPYDARSDSPAFYLYSSGTTGRPKGVVHSHNSVLQVGRSLRRLGLGEGSRIFSSSKFFFAYGLEHGLLGPLAIGASSILYADWPDVDAVVDIVSRHRPDAVFSVPTIYRRLLAEAQSRLQPMREVRSFVAAGERLSPKLVQQWKAACGRELLNLYGTSETFCASLLTPAGTSDGSRTGEPLEGVQVRLADAQNREPAKGEPGVLWVKHPSLASGYANLPEQTRAQFQDGWFCTRDVFSRDEQGFLVHQGRSDELVKIAGQWVQPGELEEAVAGEAAISEAACVTVPDADGLERLALFVAPKGAGEEAVEAAISACERALPRHKRPKWVRAVPELPRTATGKIQRYKLREMLEQERSSQA